MTIERAIELLDEGGLDYKALGYPDRASMSEDWDIAFNMAVEIMEQVMKCDERSATKCFECINRIKNNGKKRNDKK